MAHVIITMMSGSEDGKMFKRDKMPITIGRHPNDDVYLPNDKQISRHHARISKDGDSYFIEDVGSQSKGSTNGTYVDIAKIIEKTPITSGQIFTLGNIWLRFDVIDK